MMLLMSPRHRQLKPTTSTSVSSLPQEAHWYGFHYLCYMLFVPLALLVFLYAWLCASASKLPDLYTAGPLSPIKVWSLLQLQTSVHQLMSAINPPSVNRPTGPATLSAACQYSSVRAKMHLCYRQTSQLLKHPSLSTPQVQSWLRPQHRSRYQVPPQGFWCSSTVLLTPQI